MNRNVNVLLQCLLAIAQATNIVQPILAPKTRVIVTAIIAAVQGIIGIVAHNYNPDGSSAKEAYGFNNSNTGTANGTTAVTVVTNRGTTSELGNHSTGTDPTSQGGSTQVR